MGSYSHYLFCNIHSPILYLIYALLLMNSMQNLKTKEVLCTIINSNNPDTNFLNLKDYSNHGNNVFQARERLETESKALTRQATMVATKSRRHQIPIQKSLLDMRGYYTALKERERTKLIECQETGTKVKDLPYGVYEGATQRDMRQEIQDIINEGHPSKRRARESHRLLQQGKDTGKIMEQCQAVDKFEGIMKKKYDHRRGKLVSRGTLGSITTRATSRLVLPPLPVDRSIVHMNSVRSKYMRTGLSRSVTYAASPGA